LFMRIYGVGEKLRDVSTRAWNLLLSPITLLVVVFIDSVLTVIDSLVLSNPIVFCFSVSLMIASGSLILAAKKMDQLRRRLGTIASSLVAMSLALNSFEAYYRAPHSIIRAYTLLTLGAVFLTLGVMALLSIRIKRLEKVLRLKTGEIS